MKSKVVRMPDKLISQLGKVMTARKKRTGETVNFSAVVRDLLWEALEARKKESTE